MSEEQPTRRVTRRQAKQQVESDEMSEDNQNFDSFENDEDEDDEYKMSEDEEEEDFDEDDDVEEEVDEDDFVEEDDDERPKSRRRKTTKRTITKKTRANTNKHQTKEKKNTIKHLTFKEMKDLFIYQSDVIKYSDEIIFKSYVMDKYIKDIHSGNIGWVKDIKRADPVEIDGKTVGWNLTVQTHYSSKKRSVSVENLDNEPIDQEEFKKFVEKMKNDIQTSEDAKEKIKQFKELKEKRNDETNYNYNFTNNNYGIKFTQKEQDDYKKYMLDVMKRDIDNEMEEDDDDATAVVKKTKKEKSLKEDAVVDNYNDKEMKMEEEIETEEEEPPADFVYCENIFTQMKECHKRCNEMEQFLNPYSQQQSAVKDICQQFFIDFEKEMEIENTITFEQVVVKPKQSERYEELTEDSLSKYL